jgi:hypothetical protein
MNKLGKCEQKQAFCDVDVTTNVTATLYSILQVTFHTCTVILIL